jgi:hypothetical protein
VLLWRRKSEAGQEHRSTTGYPQTAGRSDDKFKSLELRGGDALKLARTSVLQLTAQTDAHYLGFKLA